MKKTKDELALSVQEAFNRITDDIVHAVLAKASPIFGESRAGL
jgi:hypothetical protein